MREFTVGTLPGQNSVAEDAEESSLEAFHKAGFKDLLDMMKTYQRTQQVSDEGLRFLYGSLLAWYVGCLLESKLDAKMTKWSNKLLKHWFQH